MLTAIGGGLVALGLGMWLVRWRRRQNAERPLTPRWLNEHVYEKEGDKRWWSR